MAAGVKGVDSVAEFNKLLNNAGSNLVVVHFAAPWAPQCQQMTDVMSELCKDGQLSQVQFVQIEAEKLAEVSEKNKIIAVPTFIFFKGSKSVDRLDGANAADLTKKVRSLASGTAVSPAPPPQKQDLNSRLKQLINQAPVMLFMKGNPQEPRCGFSRQITQILNDKNVSYSTFDILSDDEVRQGLKTFSNWPTYPQLYSNGELLGGLDIVNELVETGELESQLPTKVKLEDRSAQPVDSIVQDKRPMCCDADSCLDRNSQTNIPNELGSKDTTSITSDAHKHSTLSSNCEEVDLNSESHYDRLPLWTDDGSGDSPAECQGDRSEKRRSDECRREMQKLCQRERRDVIRSDPSLLAAQREKERLRMMMIRRRDSLILSLPVDPHMSIEDANKMLVDQQKAAGVPEEDVTSLQVGRESFSTIGELKHRIEARRAVDRERTRTKRAQLDESLKEQNRRACRERMREKRARLRQYDPAAAAAHREREKIRKRIERRRNSLLLSLSQEGSDTGNGLSLAPEFSTALNVLRENLLQKRQEQKERVRLKRANLRQNHPDLAAALREKERIRKKIERRRNSLLLSLSPDALLMVTQSLMSQDSSICLETLQALGERKDSDDSLNTDEDLESDEELSPGTDSSLQRHKQSLNVESVITDMCESDPPSGMTSEWMSTIGKLKKSVEHKKKYNKERMRRKRARIKQDPLAFEAMKEKERVRKQLERLKKKRTSVTDGDSPLMFSYDSVPSSTVTLSECRSENPGNVSEDGVSVTQEHSDYFDDSSSCSDLSMSSPSKIRTDCLLEGLTCGGQNGPTSTVDARPQRPGHQGATCDMNDSSSTCAQSACDSDVNACDKNLINLQPNFNSENDPEHFSPVHRSVSSDYGWYKNSVDNAYGSGQANAECSRAHGLQEHSDVCSFDGASGSAPVMRLSPVKQLNSLTPRAQYRRTSKPAKSGKDFPLSYPPAPLPAGLLKSVKLEAMEAIDLEDIRNGVRSNPRHIPSFTSVEDERSWFQTQLCQLQTRVADFRSHRMTSIKDQPMTSDQRDLCQTAKNVPMNSLNPSSFNFYNSTAGGYQSKPLSEGVASPQMMPPVDDRLSGIAEMTLRSSLEQVTALAGPEVMQVRLQQMVSSAKQARDKATEQARRRREKMRKDPALRHKYEVTKARDLARKRQMRAKEAQIRTMFPRYNEERRIKDRERKKMIRHMKCNTSEMDNESSANDSGLQTGNLSNSQGLGIGHLSNSQGLGIGHLSNSQGLGIGHLSNAQVSASRNAFNSDEIPGVGSLCKPGSLPPFASIDLGPTATAAAAHNYWASMYAGYSTNPQFSTLAVSARSPLFLPYQGTQNAESVGSHDIKPSMTPEHRLTS